MPLPSKVGQKTINGGQMLLNRLSASRVAKTKTIRPYGREESQEISIWSYNQKRIFCFKDGSCLPQVLLNLRHFNAEVTLDHTNSYYFKIKLDETFLNVGKF